jgi:hypothetical protein
MVNLGGLLALLDWHPPHRQNALKPQGLQVEVPGAIHVRLWFRAPMQLAVLAPFQNQTPFRNQAQLHKQTRFTIRLDFAFG